MSESRTMFPNSNAERISASIEISPKQALESPDLASYIPADTRVYITDLATHNPEEMANACASVRSAGLVAVPHIAARRLKSLSDLEIKVKLFADAGVDDVLVIGGSPEQVEGEITSTMEVLESGLLDLHGIKHIGVAGHPEGSPDFSDEVAWSALRLKKQFAERTDAKMRLVTQFGFDPDVFINWAQSLKEHEIDLPVHLGVAGPAKITTLLKYAAMCGVGNSINFLKKRASVLTTLVTSHSPEAMVGPIEQFVQTAEQTNIRGIHAFPFGGLKKTSEWLQERGSWRIPANDVTFANQA